VAINLESLLTFIGILVAAAAIGRPVQRRSLMLFIPARYLIIGISLSFIFILWRDAPLGVKPPFGWPLADATFCLTVLAFAVPVAAALLGWRKWQHADLEQVDAEQLRELFQAALREKEFDEVERILRRNQDTLTALPPQVAAVLFHPSMVAALVDSYSLIHLELLSKVEFLESLKDRHAAIDAMTRVLLKSELSPLRSAAASRYGSFENLLHGQTEQELMEKTFQNPAWYLKTSAHYPLVISAVELLATTKLDAAYNGSGRSYETTQGISARSHCPVYLALKTEKLAIEAALREHVDGDFYVSDFFDMFRAIQERSKFEEDVWKSSINNSEYPTPFAYLLHTIAWDLRGLAETAVQEALRQDSPTKIDKPGQIAKAIAQTWSMCVWNIARSEGQVSPEFRKAIIEQYFVFLLELKYQLSEICFSPPTSDVEGLDDWVNLFLKEVQERVNWSNTAKKAIFQEAFESLDQGKGYVFNGSDWLEKELF
jgi:hypothetical protein